MIKYLFSVYDVKAAAFSNPFVAVNSNVAVRSFSTAANDPNSEICQYAPDFILYQIASFDDVTGCVSPEPERIHLGIASQFKEYKPSEV